MSSFSPCGQFNYFGWCLFANSFCKDCKKNCIALCLWGHGIDLTSKGEKRTQHSRSCDCQRTCNGKGQFKIYNLVAYSVCVIGIRGEVEKFGSSFDTAILEWCLCLGNVCAAFGFNKMNRYTAIPI